MTSSPAPLPASTSGSLPSAVTYAFVVELCGAAVKPDLDIWDAGSLKALATLGEKTGETPSSFEHSETKERDPRAGEIELVWFDFHGDSNDGEQNLDLAPPETDMESNSINHDLSKKDSEKWTTVGRRRDRDGALDTPEPAPPTPSADFPPLPAPANPQPRKEIAPIAAHFQPLPSHLTTAAEGRAVATGVLHLFRSAPESFPPPPSAVPPSEPCLAILAIPSYLTASDFLASLPPSRSISHIRLLRDGTSYSAVIKFRSESSLQEFTRRCLPKKWPSGPSWTLVRIEGIIFTERSHVLEPAEKLFRPSTSTPIELPTCPVCLDRLDSPTTGLITTLCLHTFHAPCLASCPPRCPVCRHPTHPSPTQRCECGAERDLWICLLCGNIGCGRYTRGCARNHAESTGHRFALEPSEGRVWDYTADGYVHRLVRDKDGSAIPLPAPSDPLLELSLDQAQGESSDSVPREKVDALNLEYAHVFARELEMQRTYFEERMRKSEERWEEIVEELRVELETSVQVGKEAKDALEKTMGVLEASEKERTGLRKLLERSGERLSAIQKQLDEEKALSRSLATTLQSIREESKKKDEEIGELKETVRDLMVAFEVGKQVAERPELEGAGVEVATPSPKGRKGRKK